MVGRSINGNPHMVKYQRDYLPKGQTGITPVVDLERNPLALEDTKSVH